MTTVHVSDLGRSDFEEFVAGTPEYQAIGLHKFSEFFDKNSLWDLLDTYSN
jgi:hypothetical protein